MPRRARFGGPVVFLLKAGVDTADVYVLYMPQAQGNTDRKGTTMKLIVTTAHPSLYQHPDPDTGADLHGNLGRLLTPRHTSSVELTAAAGIEWACDNDCFQELNVKRYTDMLDRVTGLPGCKFVTVPDKVADAFETARLFEQWAPALERRGLPVGLVLQDGIERPSLVRWLERSWHRIDAVFVGGSDEFKEGPVAATLCREAKRYGKHVHWGRVNTRRRMRYIASTEAVDTVDGSKWARWRTTYLNTGLRWARELTPADTPTDLRIAA